MEKSCGVITFDGTKVLLVTHTSKAGGHTDFPKGHAEQGETEEETALRELREETGLEAEIVPGFRETIRYEAWGNPKEVVFFVGKAITKTGSSVDPHIESFIWIEYKDALKALTYGNARQLLKKALAFLNI